MNKINAVSQGENNPINHKSPEGVLAADERSIEKELLK